MKKRILVLIIISLLIVCGCGNKTNKNIQKENKMVGVYVLASIKEKNKNYTKEDINKIKNDYRITIFDNNQAELYFNKQQFQASYDKNSFISQDKDGNEIRLEYQYKNNAITINYFNGVYVFKK